MEDTPRGQRTSVSKKSTGREDGGPPTGTTAHISSDNNSGAKTLIKYDIDESLEIKEEIIQDQQTKSESVKPTERHNSGSYACTSTRTSSDNNSDAKALVEFDFVECFDIKQEIVEDGHERGNLNLLSGQNLNEKCRTEISSDSNSGAKVLGEYDFVEVLDIKREIVQDEGHQPLKIKEETIQDQENIDMKCEAKLCPLDRREVDITSLIEPSTSKKKKIQESSAEPEKRYNCDRCARSYLRKRSLNTHKKFECGVMPQFRCEFCGKRFKKKSAVSRHVNGVHLNKNLTASQTRHNCVSCSRTYSSLKSLNRHKLLEHVAVKPQFICDFCGFQGKRKDKLSEHITSRHLEKIQLSIPEPERKYKCEKCARSYNQKYHLNQHKKFDCGVIAQFGCEFCGQRFRRRYSMNGHILRMHQKTEPKASQTRYNCNKCSGSFSCVDSLYRHKRLEHAAVKPQFICDYCGYKATRKASLTRHFNSKHLNL